MIIWIVLVMIMIIWIIMIITIIITIMKDHQANHIQCAGHLGHPWTVLGVQLAAIAAILAW